MMIMGFWKHFMNWWNSNNTPVDPPVEPPVEPPVSLDVFYHGVCAQGSFRSKVHKTKNATTIATRIANSLSLMNVKSVRIPSGTPTVGYWITGEGYGESKYAGFKGVDNPPVPAGEPNYFKICIEAAKQAGCGVWLTIHVHMDKDDIKEVIDYVMENDVEIHGVGISNEPYAPEMYQADLPSEEIPAYPQKIQWLRELGFEGYIGVPTLVGLGRSGREARAKEYNDLLIAAIPVSRFNDPAEKLCLEIHPYFAPDNFDTYTPVQYMDWFMSQLDSIYTSNVKVSITEWAKKNQHQFDAQTTGRVINDYLDYFQNTLGDRVVGAYYQSLGGQPTQGLYDYENDELTAQGNAFKILSDAVTT